MFNPEVKVNAALYGYAAEQGTVSEDCTDGVVAGWGAVYGYFSD